MDKDSVDCAFTWITINTVLLSAVWFESIGKSTEAQVFFIVSLIFCFLKA